MFHVEQIVTMTVTGNIVTTDTNKKTRKKQHGLAGKSPSLRNERGRPGRPPYSEIIRIVPSHVSTK
jgi:hypothetical protein